MLLLLLLLYIPLRTRTNKLSTFERETYNFPEQYILRVLISLPTNKTSATFVVSTIVSHIIQLFKHVWVFWPPLFKHEAYSISKQRVVTTIKRIIPRSWMLLENLLRFSLRLDVLRKSTAISARFKNEAFNISECYYCQLLFLRFLNKILSGY